MMNELVLESMRERVPQKDPRDGENERLRSSLKAAEDEIGRMSRILDERTEELRRLHIALSQIDQSLAWRAVGRLNQALARLAPADTRRGMLLGYIRKAARVWVNEGAKALASKAARKGRETVAAELRVVRARLTSLVLRPGDNGGPPDRGKCVELVQLVCDEPVLASSPVVQGSVEVRGWALAPSGVERLQILLDDKPVGEAKYGLLRPDVQRAYPDFPDSDRSGFSFVFDSRQASDGAHRITVRAVAKAGAVREVTGNITIDNATPRKEPYESWIECHEPKLVLEARLRAQSLSQKPRISIITPTYNAPLPYLKQAIESVRAQAYDNWELCLCDDGSTDPQVRQLLRQVAKEDKRIRVRILKTNHGISGASNEALRLATGDFVGFLDHDDELAPFALYEVAKLLNEHPDADLIYSDEDKCTPEGNRYDPFFKPDWSPDLMRTSNYLCHFTVVRTALVRDVGGFRRGYEGSQDYDLFLRVIERTERIHHIPKVLYHWRAIPSSTASSPAAKMNAHEAARRALEEHLKRTKQDAKVLPGNTVGRWRIRYARKGRPRVSIIIPTGGRMDILEQCLTGVVERTTYRNFSIIIVDNSKDDRVQELLRRLDGKLPGMRYLDHRNRPFNFSLMNNHAAKVADSPLLLFLNDDAVPLNPDWLDAMIEHAQRPEVGAVGAKLLFPDGTIQHAGVVFGVFENTGHAFKYLPGDERIPIYFDFPNVVRNCSAVTAACMMMRREVFWEVGGFDEVHLAVAFQDVDLCLRLREKGYRIVYTPYAKLTHHEAKTKVEKIPNRYEDRYMKQKWAHVIARDPYYNVNLTRKREDYSLD
jgi:GT2 family glycosyltransferase